MSRGQRLRASKSSKQFISSFEGLEKRQLFSASYLAGIVAREQGSNPSNFTDFHGEVLFNATDGVHGTQLWKSDGTADGTVEVANLSTTSVDVGVSQIMRGTNDVLIQLKDGTLVISDGTADGTHQITGLTSTQGQFVEDAGDPIFYNAADAKVNGVASPNAQGWYEINPDGSTRFLGTITNSSQMHVYGGAIYYTQSGGYGVRTNGLYRIDPDGSRTFVLPGATAVGLFKDTLYTVAPGTTGSVALFSIDTTHAMTKIADLPISASPYSMSGFVTLGHRFVLVFQSSTNTSQYWWSDGTAAGTEAIPFNIKQMYFDGPACAMQVLNSDGTTDMWITDGSVDTSFKVLSAGNLGTKEMGVGSNDHYLYFSYYDPTTQTSTAWQNDGTPNGTVQIDYGTQSHSGLAGIGNQYFYQRPDPVLGNEVFFGDTYADAQLVKNINVQPIDTKPSPLVKLGLNYYFTADDGIHGRELYVTDLTANGTHRIEDLAAGIADGVQSNLITDGRSLYFIGSTDSTGGQMWHLFKSDGTPAGTVRLTLPVGDASSLFLLGGQVHVASTSHELYRLGAIDGVWYPVSVYTGTPILGADGYLYFLQNLSNVARTGGYGVVSVAKSFDSLLTPTNTYKIAFTVRLSSDGTSILYTGLYRDHGSSGITHSVNATIAAVATGSVPVIPPPTPETTGNDGGNFNPAPTGSGNDTGSTPSSGSESSSPGGTSASIVAPTVSLSYGVLTIDGGNQAVAIDVSSHANGLINVVLNGVSRHFKASDVKSLMIKNESADSEFVRQLSNLPATIYGSAGNDSIDSQGPSTVVHAGAGDDEINVYAGSNSLYGDAGSDTIHGGLATDRIYGGDGNDYLDGGSGNDILYGQAGNDRLFGSAGIDHLDGGAGTNLLRGGDGHDVISYRIGDDIHANGGDKLAVDVIVG